MNFRHLYIVLVMVLIAFTKMGAAIQQHVQWNARIETGADTTLVINVSVDEGWHIYGLEMPALGEDAGLPDPTTVSFDAASGVRKVGPLQCSQQPQDHFDELMSLTLPWLSGQFELRQRISIAGGNGHIKGDVLYMACTQSSCTPPDRYRFNIPFGTPATTQIETPVEEVPAPTVTGHDHGSIINQWWTPVDVEQQNEAQSYWMILILGFVGGLIALMTPCIWPMIPMTVSFFLKRSKNSRAKAIGDALAYALSIIVIFVTLGIVLTLIFGPGELNKIATGAVFNLIFFALLLFFAISFFGAFEIKLPEKWTQSVDSKANTATGLLGIFFMAFTLVLVSFSCTGPIIGTLLVEAFSQSNLMGPLLGMTGFALGLALPFGLFAFFPTMLSELPKSGSWLNSVKVVLGFIELILSLKFLSVADLAYGWHILDREVFLSLWIVLFVLLGLYLLGKIRFAHDAERKHTGLWGFFLGIISFSFAVYLLPGLWGAPLKAVSAFAPPLYTQDFNLYGGQFEEYDNYNEGMEAAAAAHKPVLLDFSGYACVNCRKMEGAVFDTPTVRGIIEKDYVMIKLMVDDKAQLARPMTVTEEGREVSLETVGELWSYLQRHKFGTNQQPYYILLDNDGRPLSAPRAHDENVGAFVGWLETGVQNYKNK